MPRRALPPGGLAECEATYRRDCEPDRAVMVELTAQDACLDAIEANVSPRCTPAACRATWGEPAALKSFCTD